MMLDERKRVCNLWNYSSKILASDVPEEIKIVISFREKALSKVATGTWTLEEYEQFSTVIKKSTVRKFVEFIDIANLLLEMPKEETMAEVHYLIDTGFLKQNASNDSDVKQIANLIVEIQAKLFSMLNQISVNSNDSIDEKIQFYENLLLEFDNTNNGYCGVVINTYKEWAEKTFKNEKLKAIILSQESILVSRIKKIINYRLRNLYFDKQNNTVNSFFKQRIVKKV